MKDNFDKLWFQVKHNENAKRRALEMIQATGRALPCKVVKISGATVTVSFEVNSSVWTLPQITIPKAESPWIRMPTQDGDFGFTVPADCYLGGVSGLGGGTADLRPRGNLTALVFTPISNSNSPPIDPNAAQVQGPNGVIIQTTSGTTSSIVVNQNGITLTYGGKTVVLNSSGLTIDGIIFDTHRHTGVSTGNADTGGPVSA